MIGRLLLGIAFVCAFSLSAEEAASAKLPLRVCVLDFTSIDIEGQARFLGEGGKPIVIPTLETLNSLDRKPVNSVMQGFVRMIDAWDSYQTNEANRDMQLRDNAFERIKALELYNTVVKSELRPLVIGADYLAAYLGRHSDAFSCVDASLVTAAMMKLQAAPDFPTDFMARLAAETGVTHLVYGTVSDLRTKSNSFSGYGIETKTTDYQLDVIIKVVDLVGQNTIHGDVYTGRYREQSPVSGTQIDNNVFQTLMTSAIEQAAEDMYSAVKPSSEANNVESKK